MVVVGAGGAGLAPVIPKLNLTGAAGAGTGAEAAGLGDKAAPGRAPPTGAAALPPNAELPFDPPGNSETGLGEDPFPKRAAATGAGADPNMPGPADAGLPAPNGLPAAIDELLVDVFPGPVPAPEPPMPDSGAPGSAAAAGCFGGKENPVLEAVGCVFFSSSCLLTGAGPNENFGAAGFDGAAGAVAGAVGIGFAAAESNENPEEDDGGAEGLPSPSSDDWLTGFGALDGAAGNNESGFAASGAGAADPVAGLPNRGLVVDEMTGAVGAEDFGAPKLKGLLAAGAGVAALLLDSSGLLEGNVKNDPPDDLLSSGFVNVMAGNAERAEFFSSSSFFRCLFASFILSIAFLSISSFVHLVRVS